MSIFVIKNSKITSTILQSPFSQILLDSLDAALHTISLLTRKKPNMFEIITVAASFEIAFRCLLIYALGTGKSYIRGKNLFYVLLGFLDFSLFDLKICSYVFFFKFWSNTWKQVYKTQNLPNICESILLQIFITNHVYPLLPVIIKLIKPRRNRILPLVNVLLQKLIPRSINPFTFLVSRKAIYWNISVQGYIFYSN